MLSKPAALLLIALPLLVFSGQWGICDYTIKIERTEQSGVRATVKEVAPKNPAFCLQVGAGLRFEPETENYQSMLPRKRWPKAGASVAVRYRQLVGFCKNDGDTKPCTITHYSVLNRR